MVSKHILIVDDEPKVGFFLGRSLKLTNKECEVSTARSGEEALEILKEAPVDLLITDLRMPGISGLELIRWAQATRPETQTILITAYGSDKVKAEAQRLKVYHYITKPFNVREFTAVVKKALQKMAVTKPGFAIFSGQAFEEITEQLEQLRNDIDARCIFLADAQGQRLTEVGLTEGIDSTMLLTLLAGGLVTSAEMARQFNDGQSTNFNFQKGERYDIYSANVGESLIIAIIFDSRAQKSRVGMVWLYTRRVIQKLLDVLSSPANDAASDEVLEDDFGSSLMAELDTAFAEESPDTLISTPKTPSSDKPMASAPTPTPSAPKPSQESPRSTPGEEGQDHNLLSMEEAIKNGVLPPDFFSD